MSGAIEIGDYVRVYDYDCRDLKGDNACFTEGLVIGFEDDGNVDRGRYVVMADRDMWGGKNQHVRVGTKVFPPANGRVITPSNVYCNRVELLKKNYSSADRPQH